MSDSHIRTDAAYAKSGKVRLQDGAGNDITSTANALDVNIKSGGGTGGGVDPVGLKDASDVRINPATDEKLDDIVDAIEAIPPGGADPVGLKTILGAAVNPATSEGQVAIVDAIEAIPAPPAAITGFATETTLAAIKSTDGIKKITDALPTGSNAIGKLAANSGVDIGDVDVTSIAAGANTIGNVNLVDLVWLASNSYDVNATSVQLFDSDGANSACKYITVTNCGTGDLFIRIGGSAPVGDGSTAYYDFKLALGETRWIPVGYKAATSTVNDVYGIRSAVQTNNNVIVSQYGYGS